MKVKYDLSLKGQALYYENLRLWLEAHENAEQLVTKQDDQNFIQAIYTCPRPEDFERFKKIDKLLSRCCQNHENCNFSEVKE